MEVVGQVAELWRYPVKGLLGETVEVLELDRRGVVGDRSLAIVGADGKLASTKTTRRFRRMPGLMTMRSRTGPDGSIEVEVGDGVWRSADDPLTAERVGAVVGEPVQLLGEQAVPHLDDGPVHVLTTAAVRSIGDADRRRFRPNVLIDVDGPGRPEDAWIGHTLTTAHGSLRVTHRTIRCVAVTLAQEELASDIGLLRRLEHEAELCMGAYASPAAIGHIRVGDVVELDTVWPSSA